MGKELGTTYALLIHICVNSDAWTLWATCLRADTFMVSMSKVMMEFCPCVQHIKSDSYIVVREKNELTQKYRHAFMVVSFWLLLVVLSDDWFRSHLKYTLRESSITIGTFGHILWGGYTWWRHQMETFSALLATCAENSPVPGEFPTQRPVTRSFDVYFDLRPNKWLSKQSWGWWFETLSCSLWRHRNDTH